jgi:hypothetical protein
MQFAGLHQLTQFISGAGDHLLGAVPFIPDLQGCKQIAPVAFSSALA